MGAKKSGLSGNSMFEIFIFIQKTDAKVGIFFKLEILNTIIYLCSKIVVIIKEKKQ